MSSPYGSYVQGHIFHSHLERQYFTSCTRASFLTSKTGQKNNQCDTETVPCRPELLSLSDRPHSQRRLMCSPTSCLHLPFTFHPAAISSCLFLSQCGHLKTLSSRLTSISTSFKYLLNSDDAKSVPPPRLLPLHGQRTCEKQILNSFPSQTPVLTFLVCTRHHQPPTANT